VVVGDELFGSAGREHDGHHELQRGVLLPDDAAHHAQARDQVFDLRARCVPVVRS
jgi:hypothetical protein